MAEKSDFHYLIQTEKDAGVNHERAPNERPIFIINSFDEKYALDEKHGDGQKD